MIQEYSVGKFILQPFRQLLCDGIPVSIRRKELDLLSVLAMAESMLVTKEELMAAIWPGAIVEDNALQVHVASLRKLLHSDADLLSTVHGFGYRLLAARIGKRPDQPIRMQSVADRATFRLVELMQSGDEVVALLASQALLNQANSEILSTDNKSHPIQLLWNGAKN